jgi:inner membrane protein
VDNLAHTLVGVAAARAGLSRRYGRGTTLTVAVASNLPDLDALYAWWDGWDRFMLRRTHTHALLTLPILAALLALVLRARYRHIPWKALFGLSMLGLLLHDFFDLVNSFGVVLLWPLTRARFELASVFIVDPWIWGLGLAPLAAGLFLREEAARIRLYRASLAGLGLYVLLCLGAHARATSVLPREGAERIEIFPEPGGPHRFRAAVKRGGEWRLHLCHLLSGRVEPGGVFPTDEAAPRVAEVRRSPKGRDLEWFMAAPVWTLRPDGSVEVRDLRFHTLSLARDNPFVVVFPAGSLAPAVR